MNNIEFGININIKGNAATAGKQLGNAMQGAAKGVDQLGKASNRTLGDLLALQSSLFVVTQLGVQLQQFGFGFARLIGGGFFQAVQQSGDLQQALIALRASAGDSFTEARQQVLEIANATPFAATEIVGITRRILGLGISTQQALKPINGLTSSVVENLSFLISVLSPQAQARALGGVSNILTNIKSLELLLDIGVPEAAKNAFRTAATEADKFAVIAQVLDQNARGLAGEGGILTAFAPAFNRAIQQIEQTFSTALLPLVDELGQIFSSLADELSRLREDENTIKQIQEAFSGLTTIALFAANSIKDIILFIAELVKSRPGLVNFLLLAGLAVGTIVGLLGTLTIALASVALFAISLRNVAIQFGGATAGAVSFTGALKGLLFVLGRVAIVTAVLFALFAAFSEFPDFFDRFGKGAQKLGVSLGTIANILVIIGTISAAILGGVAGFFIGGPIGALAGALAGGAGAFAFLSSLASDIPGLDSGSSAANISAPVDGFTIDGGAQGEGARTEAQIEAQRRAVNQQIAEIQARPIEANIMLDIDGRRFLEQKERLERQEGDRFTLEALKTL